MSGSQSMSLSKLETLQHKAVSDPKLILARRLQYLEWGFLGFSNRVHASPMLRQLMASRRFRRLHKFKGMKQALVAPYSSL